MLFLRVTGVSELARELEGIQLTLEGRMFFEDLLGVAAEDISLYAASITPVITGRLQAGHSVIGAFRNMTWWVFNEVEYAEYVHAMGGHRAFYDRTVIEYVPEVADRVIRDLAEAIGL